MRFTRLTLKNWRNFKHVDVELRDRVFVMGPNASGKSNLLDAFRFLRDIAQEQGGLKYAVDHVRGGFSAIRSLHATRNSDVEIAVAVGDDDDPDQWSYTLKLAASSSAVEIKSESVHRNGKVLFSRPTPTDVRDRKRLSQTHLEQVNENEKFRELVKFLGEVTYVHLVPQLLREPQRYAAVSHDPYGGDFLNQIARTPDRKRTARLKRIIKALRVALPRFDNLEFKRDELGHPHLRVKYKNWRSQGTWQQEDRFSDGTLRLLGLLWVLAEGTAPLLLEEPELSLHSEVVRQIPRIMAKVTAADRRQVIVSTHSELLLDEKGIEPDEILLLRLSEHETVVESASDDPSLVAAAAEGESLGGYLVAKTRPEHAEQLAIAWGR